MGRVRKLKTTLNFAIFFVTVHILRHRFPGPKFFFSFIVFKFCLKFVLRQS